MTISNTGALVALFAAAVLGGMSSAFAFSACQVTDTGGVDDKGSEEAHIMMAQRGTLRSEREWKVFSRTEPRERSSDWGFRPV